MKRIFLAALMAIAPAIAVAGPLDGTYVGVAKKSNGEKPFSVRLTVQETGPGTAMVQKVTDTANLSGSASVKGNTVTFGDAVSHVLVIKGKTATISMRHLTSGIVATANLRRE